MNHHSRRGCTSPAGSNGQQICTNATSMGSGNNWTATGIGSGLGVFAALVLFILLFVWVERRKKRRANDGGDMEGAVDEEEDDDRGFSNDHNLDVDTTPQGYYSQEDEIRSGLKGGEKNDHSTFNDSKSIPESSFAKDAKVISYPPPPALITTKKSSQSSTTTSSYALSNQSPVSPDGSSKSTKRLSGSSIPASTPKEEEEGLVAPVLLSNQEGNNVDQRQRNDVNQISLPPPAYNENAESVNK